MNRGATILAVVDYDAGNLRSVVRAIEHAGAVPTVTSDPGVVSGARAVILPGVGSARQAMDRLAALGMDDALRSVAERGVPLFGVCLGQQLLLDHSDEGDEGGTTCLGVLPGQVRRFPPGLKVPHMGWNTVSWREGATLASGIAADSFFYFVHSYFTEAPAEVVMATTCYGVPFCSVVARNNVVATQFHPEKSGRDGLRLYANFLRMAGICS
jgi:imidazole glycerol-phosphate synthase subunit HisH